MYFSHAALFIITLVTSTCSASPASLGSTSALVTISNIKEWKTLLIGYIVAGIFILFLIAYYLYKRALMKRSIPNHEIPDIIIEKPDRKISNLTPPKPIHANLTGDRPRYLADRDRPRYLADRGPRYLFQANYNWMAGAQLI